MPAKDEYYKNLDLTGQKFNRLTALYKIKNTRTKWHCICDCGIEKDVSAGYLIRGWTKSCGCLEKENRESFKDRTQKHGMTNTILYKKWCGMKSRCYNPNYKHYDRYGGRGITMCPEWLGEDGFINFAKWAYANGYDDTKKGYEQSIDRMNTDGNYCPDNCKWSNQFEQVKNRSNSFLITDIDGEELTHVQFSIKHGIDSKNLFVYRRMRKGLSASEIIQEWEEYIHFEEGEFYKILDYAKINGVSRETVILWIRQKKITAYKVRKSWYIPKDQPRP